MPNNGWKEWSIHVLAELERLSTSIEKLDEKMDKFIVQSTQDVTNLKAKAGIWGAAAGLIPSILAISYLYLRNHL